MRAVVVHRERAHSGDGRSTHDAIDKVCFTRECDRSQRLVRERVDAVGDLIVLGGDQTLGGGIGGLAVGVRQDAHEAADDVVRLPVVQAVDGEVAEEVSAVARWVRY